MTDRELLAAYTARLGDNALVLGQRMIELVAAGPELEEELANANFALDFIGQARLFYTYAADCEGQGRTEDDLAFLRREHEYRNLLLVEQPNGHFGDLVVRRFLFETFYVYLRDDVALANIGHGGEKYVPYVVTLFFFILFSNLLGLVPFGATSTSNIMVTAALALISLIVVEAAGMSELGFKGWLGTIFYAPKGLHPVMRVVMLIIMTPVELIGKLAKPFALAVRLFANMTAGHFVILALLGLILTYGSFTRITGVAAISGSLLLGLFVMFLEIFVAFLQAYIFTALTAVFIGLIRHAH